MTAMLATSPPRKNFSLLRALLFSAPQLGENILMAGFAVLAGVYAKHYGISLASIGAILVANRLIDALTDPLIGAWSDRMRATRGSRKPLMLIGGAIMSIAALALFMPPFPPSELYLAIWMLGLFLGWTLYRVPHFAWVNEVTRTSEERTLVFSLFAYFTTTGNLVFFFIPLLGLFGSTAITPPVLSVAACLGVAFFLPALLLTLKQVSNGHLSINPVPNKPLGVIAAARGYLTAFSGNRPFLWFVGAMVFGGVGLGAWGGMIFIYVDAFLGRGEAFASIALMTLAAGLAFVAVWQLISRRIGKRRAWFLANTIMLVCFLSTGLLSPNNASYPAIVVIYLTAFGAGACYLVVVPAIMSEIADYGALKNKRADSGAYFSLYFFILKAQASLGAGIGLAIAGYLGFDATLAPSEQTTLAVFGLKLGIAWFPAGIVLVGTIFIALFPLTEKKHAIIQKRLAQLRQRQQRIDPVYPTEPGLDARSETA